MEKVREILRLCLDLNYSLRDAGIALGVSKNYSRRVHIRV